MDQPSTAGAQVESGDQCARLFSHGRDGEGRGKAGCLAHAGVVENHHLVSRRERIDEQRRPVVHRRAQAHDEQQRRPAANLLVAHGPVCCTGYTDGGSHNACGRQNIWGRGHGLRRLGHPREGRDNERAHARRGHEGTCDLCHINLF